LILATQLTITAAAVGYSALSPGFLAFAKAHMYLYVLAFVVSLITLYSLVCYPELARSVPTNYILLFLFTIAESYLVANMTMLFTPKSVLLAALLTAAIVLALTIYAFKTDTDFTYAGGSLFVVSALMVVSLFAMFIQSKILDMIIAFVSACLFGMYLIYDTQLIIGGEGKAAAYEIDDYVLAAMNVYIDIIQLFIEILRLIGDRR
jgi:protein lifeguard